MSYYNYSSIYNFRTTQENFNPPLSPQSKDAPESKDPSVWGPHAWKFLHIMAENYPKNPCPLVRSKAKQFINALPFMLPCETCSVHAMAFIDEHNAELDTIVSSRDTLANFFVKFHNYVNQRYGKKVYSTPFDIKQIRSLYK